jgi:hypothetical protein
MADTTPESVAWHAREGVQRQGRGWVVRPADRLYRPMRVYSGGAIVPVDVRGSRKASEVAAYHLAVHHYLSQGDDSRLRAFAGKTVAGVEYETDLDILNEMVRRGEIGVESIYRLVT